MMCYRPAGSPLPGPEPATSGKRAPLDESPRHEKLDGGAGIVAHDVMLQGAGQPMAFGVPLTGSISAAGDHATVASIAQVARRATATRHQVLIGGAWPLALVRGRLGRQILKSAPSCTERERR